MKKITFILFFLIVALAASAQKYKHYKSTTENFTVDYPEAWQLSENFTPQIVMMAIAPRESDNDDFSENINVVVDPTDLTGITVEYYRDLSAAGIKSVLTNVKVDSVGVDKVKSGMQAGTIIYSHKAAGFNLKVLSYLFIIDNKGYVITCSAKASDFDKYAGFFIKVCKSFSAAK